MPEAAEENAAEGDTVDEGAGANGRGGPPPIDVVLEMTRGEAPIAGSARALGIALLAAVGLVLAGLIALVVWGLTAIF